MVYKKTTTGNVFTLIIGILTIATYIWYMPSIEKTEDITELIQGLLS